MQPGETITPGQSGGSPVSPQPPVPAPTEPPIPTEVAAEETFYKPDTSQLQGQASPQPPSQVSQDEQTISWEGSEYVDHQKPAGWYVLFGGVTVIAVVASYILTHHDYMVTVSIAIAAILFGVMAARKPRILQYRIDAGGITVGDKRYGFSEFKVFSVITDTAIHSVQLVPMKRFLPPLSLHYPPDQEERVVTTLGSYLPYQQDGQDRVERLMSRIRF